jgi:hypothetical protein
MLEIFGCSIGIYLGQYVGEQDDQQNHQTWQSLLPHYYLKNYTHLMLPEKLSQSE